MAFHAALLHALLHFMPSSGGSAALPSAPPAEPPAEEPPPAKPTSAHPQENQLSLILAMQNVTVNIMTVSEEVCSDDRMKIAV